MSIISEAKPTLTKALDDRPLSEIDPAIHAVLEDEKRGRAHIELIASGKLHIACHRRDHRKCADQQIR